MMKISTETHHALKITIYVCIRNDFKKLYGMRILCYIWIKM